MTLARAKWQSSGLTDDQAKKLKLKPLAKEETKKLCSAFHETEALQIPYFDLDGKRTDFYRIRYLGQLPGFAGAVAKPQRYAQPPKTLNEIYFPPTRNWQKAAKNVEIDIIVTEGELKAAAGCAAGFAAMGLGGVDVWRSAKRGISAFPILDKITWSSRRVVIAYDSDAAINPNVVRAQRQFAKELLGRGAKLAVASIPPTKEGAKQGLDDLLVAQGKIALDSLIAEAPAFPESDALWELNEEVISVRKPGVIVERATGLVMDPGSFVSYHYANRQFLEIKFKPDGSPVSAKPKSTAKRWLEWRSRNEARELTYAPGKPRLVNGAWNTWPGWGVAPEKGDVGPWTWLLDFIFGKDQKSRKWFEQWCAYPIQHPGTKLYSAVLIWGSHKGTGKSMLAYMLGAIYGRNFIEIKNKDLRGGFNSWASNRQLVYGDEINGRDARIDADWLKGLITQPVVRVNEKFLPEYVIPDHMNYIFGSNHPDALFVEDHDRRYFIHEVVGPPAERAKYEAADKWLHGTGPAHLMEHLLQVDLRDFNPREHAQDTPAKRSMIYNSKSELGAWCVQLREDPASALAPLGDKVAHGCEILSPTNLLRAFDPERRTPVTSPGIGRELARAGFRQLNGGSPIRIGTALMRLYAVRNEPKWRFASMKLVNDHYESFFGPNAGRY